MRIPHLFTLGLHSSRPRTRWIGAAAASRCRPCAPAGRTAWRTGPGVPAAPVPGPLRLWRTGGHRSRTGIRTESRCHGDQRRTADLQRTCTKKRNQKQSGLRGRSGTTGFPRGVLLETFLTGEHGGGRMMMWAHLQQPTGPLLDSSIPGNSVVKKVTTKIL